MAVFVVAAAVLFPVESAGISTSGGSAVVAHQAQTSGTQATGASSPEARSPGEEDLARLLPLARERELNRVVTVQDAQERLELWKMILLIDPNHLEGRTGFQQARGDLDQASAAEAATEAEASQAEQGKAEQLRRAENALYDGDLEQAEDLIDRVLAADPSDARALSLRHSVTAAERVRAARSKTLIVGLLLLFFGVVAAVVVLLWWRRRVAAAEGDTGPRALVRVVDGVGRGVLKPIEGDIFRIGAAESADESRQNHLIVSDEDHLVSRYHCEIIRRDGDYVLLDSSRNGTVVNGKPVQVGGQVRLRDGDDMVVAGVSKIRFMTR